MNDGGDIPLPKYWYLLDPCTLTSRSMDFPGGIDNCFHHGGRQESETKATVWLLRLLPRLPSSSSH
jgi:hypothetical protein